MKKKKLPGLKRPSHGARGRYGHTDPLEEVEVVQGVELPGKMHLLADKPTKPLKRARGIDERYRSTRRR